MWTSGNGTWPKKALRVSHKSTVLSLPMDQSMQSCLKAAYASRRRKMLRASSSSSSVIGRRLVRSPSAIDHGRRSSERERPGGQSQDVWSPWLGEDPLLLEDGPERVRA